MRSGVPVNQKECCWQETLRSAQEGFKWKYENKRGKYKCIARAGETSVSQIGSPQKGRGPGIPAETKGDTPVWTTLPAPGAPG